MAGRTNHTPEAWGGGREDQPHIQGAMAARAQEGLEELSHVEGQEGQWLGADTPCPRPGAVARRTNPTSKELWLGGCRRA